MANSGKMDGKGVLVTGAGTGIGRGVALEFAKEGGDVVLHYAHSSDGARSAVDEITQSGGKAAAFQADLADIGKCQELVAQARDFLGGIDLAQRARAYRKKLGPMDSLFLPALYLSSSAGENLPSGRSA